MKIISISELTAHIKRKFETDYQLSNVWVRGEISNLKQPSSGHLYFVLKDPGSCIKAVMFRSRSQVLPFSPNDGMKVIIRGYVTVYERDGQYQLYVEEIQPDGVGTLHLAFEQLKEKLNQEGLFDPARKKPIPVLPARIGIVTSPTGAAIRDILTIIERRFRERHIIIAPAAVQGYHAPREVAQAIQNLNALDNLDVIIIARGGGSLEELWAFNTELVARAIAESKIPIISAVGHETDFTIADFASDLRAPTPSAAAELVVPLKGELIQRVIYLEARLKRGMTAYLNETRSRVDNLARSKAFGVTYDKIRNYRRQVELLSDSLENMAVHAWQLKYNELSRLGGRLAALNPLATLERGYSLCLGPLDEHIASVKQIKPDQKLRVQLKDGNIHCNVIAVEENTND